MSAIARAIDLAGGPSKTAALLGCTAQAVCFYRDGRRRFPSELAARLESACGGQVRRWDFFPDTWPQIWPELIGTDGAPPVPATDPQATEETSDAA